MSRRSYVCGGCGADVPAGTACPQCHPKRDTVTAATRQQPPPTPANGRPDCWCEVMADMEQRRQFGLAKYGEPVHPGNGRDALLDAYQEALDLCVYLKQVLIERDAARRVRP